jgi:hypothetical protein
MEAESPHILERPTEVREHRRISDHGTVWCPGGDVLNDSPNLLYCGDNLDAPRASPLDSVAKE